MIYFQQMKTSVFVLLSSLYVVSLAVVDGLFNRLVFRRKRKFPYFSFFKQSIYKKWEWRAIGVVFLIFLGVVWPTFISYLAGGISLAILYLIVFFLIPWDIIFGILVFDDPWGDMPSIAIPFHGWINFSFWSFAIIRIIIVLLLILVKTEFGI